MGLETEIKLSDDKTRIHSFEHVNLQTEIHTCSTCFLHDSDIALIWGK